VGERRPPTGVAEALTRMGYRRVGTVTEVAEFSVRGGILDVYGFGMAAPARLEWWGDDISSIRGFDLTTQRSLETLEEITVLPVSTGGLAEDGAAGRPDGTMAASPPARPSARTTLLDLLPPDTLVIEESAGPDADEVQRAWKEAEHHLEVARRLGEDVRSWRSPSSGAPRWRAFPGCC
jgi:transcription-repair coupling factor (superfamily II helicase)